MTAIPIDTNEQEQAEHGSERSNAGGVLLLALAGVAVVGLWVAFFFVVLTPLVRAIG